MAFNFPFTLPHDARERMPQQIIAQSQLLETILNCQVSLRITLVWYGFLVKVWIASFVVNAACVFRVTRGGTNLFNGR